jgi:RHS repeat-associated protein
LYTGQLRQAEIGLDYFNARWYLPHLNRWIQPDTVIPDVYNPQSMNRYSYVYNNPIRYSDPSGHCPQCVTIAAGAVIGAVAGAVLYASFVSGPNFDWGDLALAAGVGAAGGALIGTGIAITQGGALFAGLTAQAAAAAAGAASGAGASMASSQVAYTVGAGDSYNSGDMLVATGVGAGVGAVSGYGGVMAPAQATTINVVAGSVGSMAQYAASESLHGYYPTAQGLLANGMLGGFIGGVSAGPPISNGGATALGARMFLEGGESALRNVTSAILADGATPILEKSPQIAPDVTRPLQPSPQRPRRVRYE